MLQTNPDHKLELDIGVIPGLVVQLDNKQVILYFYHQSLTERSRGHESRSTITTSGEKSSS